MSGPLPPNPNFPPPMPGPGNVPPQPQQYPQPNPYGQQQGYGNMPPQPPQYNAPPQQPGWSPDDYFNGGMYPPGFNPLDAADAVWGNGPVSFPVAARPPQIGHGVIRNVPKGRFIHEERARQKAKAAKENYTQRGSEQVLGFMPKVGRFLGRVAFKGTTTPPEKIQAGHQRKEVGWATRWFVAAPLGAVALGPAVISKAILMPFRYFGNRAQGRTFGESFRPVVPKKGEGPRQLRGQVPAESVYTDPYPKLGGNLPTSNKQARVNKRQANKQARQTPPAQQPQQRRRQTQQQGGKKSKSGRPKEKGF